jgi:hypothetical protein
MAAVVKYGAPSGRIEECAHCRDRLDVDERGRIPEHRAARGWDNYGPGGTWRVTNRDSQTCNGYGRPSKEEKRRRGATKNEQMTGDAAAARDDAAVALDAFLDGVTVPTLTDRLDVFTRLALHEYRRRFGVNARRVWRWETRTRPTSRTSITRGDIYCTFCGELLVRSVMRPIDVALEHRLANFHVVRCTLWFLSGIRDAVKPGTKTLPEEHRQETAS